MPVDPRDELIREKLDQEANSESVARDNFLNAISSIESSSGQNFNHPVVQGGIQDGQQAIGSYGLMPNTVQEIANRARLNNVEIPQVSRDPQAMKQELEANPDIEKQYAQQLANKVLQKFKDPEMAAYAWNKGHNLSPDDIRERGYINDPYVQKFRKVWKIVGR